MGVAYILFYTTVPNLGGGGGGGEASPPDETLKYSLVKVFNIWNSPDALILFLLCSASQKQHLTCTLLIFQLGDYCSASIIIII